MGLLLNIDVPDLEAAERFYVAAFGLTLARRIGDEGVELKGWPVDLYLLRKAPGTQGPARNRGATPVTGRRSTRTLSSRIWTSR